MPANLVFCPYEPPGSGKGIAWMDSNGLAAGNDLEEAVLHGLLEVVERDAIMISEHNRLPPIGMSPPGWGSASGRSIGRRSRSGPSAATAEAPRAPVDSPAPAEVI